MAVLSTAMFVELTGLGNAYLILPLGIFENLPKAELAAWVWLPFLFTIFGSGVGFLYEATLLVTGHPFQLMRTKLGTFVQSIRFLNLAPVVTTIFFFVCSMVIADPSLRTGILFLSGAVCFGLGFALFFGGAQTVVPAILIGTQVAQIVLVATHQAPPGGEAVAWFLIAQAVLQITSLTIGTSTPLKSTAFHIISTVSGIMLFLAIMATTKADPSFSMDVAIKLPEGSLLFWGFIVTCLAGVVITAKLSPQTFSLWRMQMSQLIWSILYFVLVSAKRFPNPFNLSKVYNDTDKKPKKTYLKPYYQVHPEFLPESLSIPAAVDLERNVTMFKQLLTRAKKSFAMIAILDHYFPQAKVAIPLKDKPRMTIWSDGSEYWPNLFTKNIFGNTIPGDGGHLEKTPNTVIQSFKDGQLLAYLTEFGVANTFAKAAIGRGPGVLMSDFRFLEKYETKEDYESYGGVAYFKVNSETQRLELLSVIAPHSTEEILANPDDATFRWAESRILASMYYQVISGKHLAEIHMTYNLVEVSMHNAFDVQGQWTHPFRTFMYIHFFSHELAEEITTEHLVQEGAVFSQIFATTHDSLISHLNDCYHDFEYGTDENVEERAALMTMAPAPGETEGKILPNACINWELEYAQIWHKYATSLINIIYKDDQAVQNDKYLQDFHDALNIVLVNGLPERYHDFKTREGVARFASDTIHHTVIRHQVYGTTGVKAALDPRIGQVQIPKDRGTPSVDEWRSLAYVALATGRARFTLLLNDFTYLLDGVDEQYKGPMHVVFENLQEDLRVLEAKWNTTDEDKKYNDDFFRTVPSKIHTGPGY
ncbi:hypothetical protein GCM10022277_12820 [Litoribacillus peritrichatus]|uniref:Uncharacterized protein n=2 Tax=Litoribacillus peritrichatus TaxID=718191 RepID=A0ABP7MEX4_9GAMM